MRLSDQGYAVRLLGGIGAAAAAWSLVDEVVAASPGGTPCLVLGLRDGRATRLPMAALAADADAFAHDVRRRVRDAPLTGWRDGLLGARVLIRWARTTPCNLCWLTGRRRLARFMAPAC